jgi:predicted nucleic acid-binding protein
MDSRTAAMAISAFVDTSVLYAAIFSTSGASRAILHAAFQGTCRLFFSALVFSEVERNLAEKAPGALVFLATFRNSSIIHLVEPSPAAIRRACDVVVVKDAPIVAAAAEASADYLLTFDRVHILRRRLEIKDAFGVDAVLPEELLPLLRIQA